MKEQAGCPGHEVSREWLGLLKEADLLKHLREGSSDFLAQLPAAQAWMWLTGLQGSCVAKGALIIKSMAVVTVFSRR